MKLKSIIIGGLVVTCIIGMSGCSLKNTNDEVKVFEKQNEEIGTVQTNESTNETNESTDGKNKKVVDVSFNYIGEEIQYAIIWGYDSNGDTVWKYQTEKAEAAQFSNVRYLGKCANNVYIVDLGILKILDLQTGEVKATSGNKPEDKAIFWTGHETFDEKNNLYVANNRGEYLYIINPNGDIKKVELNIEKQYEISGIDGDNPSSMRCDNGKLIMNYDVVTRSNVPKDGYDKVESVASEEEMYEKIEVLTVMVDLENYKVTMEKNIDGAGDIVQ